MWTHPHWRPRARTKILALVALLSPAAFGQNTCVNFPSQEGIPFASIATVTAANNAGDHLVVGALPGGTSGLSAVNNNLPSPAFTNQTFCGQVQLAPQQYYSNVYVPTASERAGVYSAFAGLLVDPSTKQPYPNGVIPATVLGAVYAWRIGEAQVASALQGWSPTGSMSVGRAQGAAALLPSGKVLMVGLGTVAELYDPATGTFSRTGPALLSHGPDLHAILLNDGRALVVGGTNLPFAAELYDPLSGTFAATASTLEAHSENFTATLLADGRVLVVGGLSTAGDTATTSSGAELYDPSSGTFKKTGPMAVNRNSHTAALLPDGRVLIAGGTGGVGAPTFSSAEIFDPSTGNFSPANPMQEPRGDHFAVVLSNGKVLIGGGFGSSISLQSAELFDPSTATFAFTGGLNTACDFCTIALLSSGQVLVTGGTPNFPAATNSAELYNAATGTFTVTGSMVTPRAQPTATVLLDGRVLVAGGQTLVEAQVPSLSSAELYTPVTEGLVTSQTGLTFRSAQSANTLPIQSVAVLSNTDTIPWTVSMHTYTGGNWLTVTPSNGTSAPGANTVTLTISTSPAGLAAQDYYGSVTLTPTDGTHPPVSIAVVLSIVPAGAAAPPAVTPSGLLFLATPGAAAKAQSFTISNLTSSTIGFNGSGSATPNWFDFTPKASGLAGGQSATITVTPNLTGLAPGVYRGSILLTFSDKSTQTVDLLLVISATAASHSIEAAPRAAAACTPTKLLPVFTAIGTGFTTPVAWPTALIVQIVDDCGNPMNTGTVTVSFNNGDVPLSLLAIGNATWAGTWVPVNVAASAFAVRADAQLAPLSGSVQVTGLVGTNPNVPLVSSGGVLSSGDYTSSPALGLLVSIFGTALADGQVSAGSLPLSGQLGSTSVVVSGEQLPVQYVSDSQVNVIIPYDLAVNAPHQLIVLRGNAISVPVPIAVFDSQPAILATAGNGIGQGHIYKVDASGNQVLADANSPAGAGDTLVIYTVGLGAIAPPVTAGDATPLTPLSRTTATTTLTIGGQQATVFFAGLTPGSAGLYQVDAIVPAGITPGGQVPVSVSVGCKSSNGAIYMGIH